MQYQGLIGKIGDAIPTTSIGKFAGIGAGAVGVIGGGLSYYENRDVSDAAGGAFRSAIFGGLLGAAVHKVPRMISNQMANTGFESFDRELGKQALDTASTTFRPFLDKLKTEENKKLVKDFKPQAKKSANSFMFGSNKQFSTSIVKSMDEAFPKLEPKTFTDLLSLGEDVIDKTDSYLLTKEGKYIKNYAKTIADQYDAMSSTEKAKNIGAYGTKLGFDSAYHHIVQPTGQFLKGNFTTENAAATAFSLYGAYEAGVAVNNIQQGDYGGAAGAMGMLVAGKLVYGQAANAIKFNSYLKEKNLTWGQVIGGGFTGKALHKFAKGATEYDNVEQSHALAIFTKMGKDRQPHRDYLYPKYA